MKIIIEFAVVLDAIVAAGFTKDSFTEKKKKFNVQHAKLKLCCLGSCERYGVPIWNGDIVQTGSVV